MYEIISQHAIDRRLVWIDRIASLSDDFTRDVSRMEKQLAAEVEEKGHNALLDHLRLCSAIPESYVHDSSEEKLYSKYTDALISESYRYIGLRSAVLTERADSADVEAITDEYSFVADAKAFRLSRTAKNQKDFKVQAMDNWKRGKPHAMIVCPLYQLPSRTSQIYAQAAARNVCVFSYSHLAVLTQLAEIEGTDDVLSLLHDIFKTVQAMNPSKAATVYWQAVNRTMLQYGDPINELWRIEKIATVESIRVAKETALAHYSRQREAIMKLSRSDAIQQLIEMHRIDSRVQTVNAVADNHLLDFS